MQNVLEETGEGSISGSKQEVIKTYYDMPEDSSPIDQEFTAGLVSCFWNQQLDELTTKIMSQTEFDSRFKSQH